MFDQRHHAFLASWVDSLRHLASRVPELEFELALVKNPVSTITSALALRGCYQFLVDNQEEVSLPVEQL